MDFWQSLAGMTRMELTCADPGAALGRLTEAEITVFDSVCLEDGVTVRFSVPRRVVKKVEAMAEKRGWGCQIIGKEGLYWKGMRLLRRPVLALGTLTFFVLSLYLPSRVFFIRVEGNTQVPIRLILEKAEACGISFGASRREVRSQKVKDALLLAIPELQWAGVNTYGSTAVITVRERAREEEELESGGVSSIVALRDAIVTELTVTRGTAACVPGQAVRSGDLLISGYTDCGLTIRAERATGEVYGKTSRELEAVLPVQWLKKEDTNVVKKKIALIIGKKRINFYKDSGIFGTGCDKMYQEKQIFLPGGFALPVYMVTEIWYDRENTEVTLPPQQAEEQLNAFALRYLQGQMIAGKILNTASTVAQEEEVFCFYGNFTCDEMIGQVRYEENLNDN